MKAIMFSGQGAQKVGMGKEFYDNFAVCRRTFEEASEALGMDMAKLCFEEKELLNQTEYAQPALLTAGISAYRLLAERRFVPDALMGLSLGEYTALTAAGVFNFADAVRLVHKRGKIMTQYAKEGGMLAAIGVDRDALEDICRKVADAGFVACANFNTPEQTVLAGEHAALDACVPLIKTAGGKAMPLKVAGPFHTPMMAEAAEKFSLELEQLSVKKAVLPVISNVDAEPFPVDEYVDTLTKHMMSPVRWTGCVEKAKSTGADTFVELGCGKTLVNFVKKIDGGAKTFAVESIEDLEGIV